MRATTLFSAVIAIAMFSNGCSGDPSGQCKGADCGTDTVDCPDCTEPGDETATVQLNFSIRGNLTECQLYGNDQLVGATNAPHVIDVGEYEFEAGSDGISSTDDLPLHPFDGMNWGCVRRPADTLEDGDNLVIDCEANAVFAGTIACTQDKYFIGGYANPIDGMVAENLREDDEPYPDMDVAVLDGYQFSIDGSSLFSFMDDDDQIEVASDSLVFTDGGTQHGTFIDQSEINSDGFTMIAVWPDAYLYDITCSFK